MHHSARSNHWTLLLVSVAAVLVGGCGPSGPSVVKITGTVTRAGKPVPDLLVNFVPEHGRPSWGFSDAQGHYALEYTREQAGAAVGKHKVFVSYQPHDPAVILAMQEGRDVQPPEIKVILEKYGKPSISPLEFEIQKSQVIDIKLD